MHILLVNHAPIPVFAYGGTERVIWDLGRALVQAGHRVSYLVPEGSHCDFAQVWPIRAGTPWAAQIPADVDVVHFQFQPEGEIGRPCLVTEHGNGSGGQPLLHNTVFVSRNHAERHGSAQFVHNGLDWSGYGPVDFSLARPRCHFLGKAAWRVKNVKGAIQVARRAGIDLDVLGGTRLNLRRGFRLTLSPHVHFHGMVGGAQKFERLNASRGLVLPVRWHEPFGLAVIESLYFGCPVFATPYGALPELVDPGCGHLAASAAELAEALRGWRGDPRACQAQVLERFSAAAMARGYLACYERVLAGEVLNAEPPRLQASPFDLPWA